MWLREYFIIPKMIQSNLNSLSKKYVLAITGSVILFCLTCLMIAYFSIRSITASLKLLVKGTQTIGEGNLDYLLPITYKNEFGQLASIINDMVSNIKKLMTSRAELENEIKERKIIEQELRTTRDELDTLVKIRTESLENTNAELSIALQEKETLFHEIHHRVKNNLTIISSLLRLQAGRIDEGASKHALLESDSRVRSMSAIHEALYHSESSTDINLKDYLSHLSHMLIRNYEIKTEVHLVINCADLMLNAKFVSPLGLIINELITNTLKYAFLDEKKGEIIISTMMTDHYLEIIYGDTGIGLPENLDWRNSATLGLRLIVDLVERQLGGMINLDIDNRSKFSIRFPLDS